MSDQNQSDLTGQSLPGGAQLTPSGGATAAEQSLSLADLEQTLGKKFPDKETALKAVKDTFAFVGAKTVAANPAPAQDPAILEKLGSLEKEVFYANNPQYRGHENIIKAMGSNPAEVVQGEAFKTYFEKAQVADDVMKTKSVVASNSRLAQATDVRTKATEVANSRGSTLEDVATTFAKEIIAAE